MLNSEKATARLNRLRNDCYAMRAFYDSYWALAKIYDHGPQWGHMTSTADGLGLHYLKAIPDPHREDVRVVVNKTHEKVVKLDGALAPEQILFDLTPRDTDSLSVRLAGTKLLSKYLERQKCLQVLRDKSMHRLVLGTAIVRRVLRQRGTAKRVGARPDGSDLMMRNLSLEWARVSPHEILRDPSADSLNFAENETIFCHEKPRPLSWVYRHFGDLAKKIKTESTLGSLMEHFRLMGAASGLGSSRHVKDSKEPAVVIYECWFQDPDLPSEWPWVLYAWLDSSGDNNQVRPLQFGPNPYYGLPFHAYTYDIQIQAPWGRGVPHVMMGLQDVLNIGWSWLVRTMIQGGPRWRYVKGSIAPGMVRTVLGNDLRKPIPYDLVNGANFPPDRVQPPNIPPVAQQILQQTPSWMMDSVNMSDVQFGQTSKRGESGEAIEAKLSEANQPLERIRKDDDLTTQDLLLGTLYDLTKMGRMTLKEARDLIGAEVPDPFIRDLLREETPKHIVGVRVHSSMHRPKTPGEIKNDFIGMAEAHLKDPERAEWEMMLRGVSTNTAMRQAHEKQLLEIKMIEAGVPVDVRVSESHKYHLWTLEWYIDQPSFMQLPPDVQDAISDEHYNAHKQAEMAQMMGEQMMQGPGMQQTQIPSPPAEAGQAMGGIPAGAAAPAMAI